MFAVMFNPRRFDVLKLYLASPSEIKSWSFGEVTKPETINYRTLKPEKDGLFCEKIFGPTRDYECYCGKYKGVRYKGVICDKCGVEVTRSKVRRERMGHIKLASPVAHTWFFRRYPSKLSLFLDISAKDLETVIYFAAFLVTEVNEEIRKQVVAGLEEKFKLKKNELEKEIKGRIKDLEDEAAQTIEKISREKGEKGDIEIQNFKLQHKKEVLFLREELIRAQKDLEESFINIGKKISEIQDLSLLSEADFAQLEFWEASRFVKVAMGAGALKEVLQKINLEQEKGKLERQLKSKSKAVRQRAIKKLRLVKGMRQSKLDPTLMILEVLPVIPPELRPMVQLPGGRFATSDLNDLYRRVINRNNRLKNLLRISAPEIILRNEKRMLQEAIDSLIEGPRRPSRQGRKQLRSLSDILKGKQGRFRLNLLGKRVDYSGRSVIVVGPELKIDQVGLPKEMALELFKPFVLREVLLNDLAPNLKSAKSFLERRSDEIWNILEKVTSGHPVLLIRQPTLHRQNIQAFYPILIEGNAIQFHPALCAGYNADFDGDTMGVFLPLSKKSIEEAKTKMLSPLNFLKLADSRPIVDMKLEFSVGLFYLTSVNLEVEGAGRTFFDREQAVSAYQNGKIDLQAQISIFWGKEKIETSVGRILFNEILPPKLKFYNEPLTRKQMRKIIDLCLSFYGIERTSVLIDDLKNLGREFGTLPGISFSVFDFEVPKERGQLLGKAGEDLDKIESNFRRGLTTRKERYNQIVTLWKQVEDELGKIASERIDPLSTVGMIINSGGSRVDKDCLRQVEAMRGLMVDSQGNIKETPIRTSTIEGATPFEGFLSALGGRKGLIDTALLTADAGYLTRRLVDVAHDVLVREYDCKTKEGVLIREDPEVEDWPLKERIVGRVATEDIYENSRRPEPERFRAGAAQGSKLIVKRNELITEELADKIIAAEVEEVEIRSLFTCKTKHGVCSLCYGQDMGTRELVKIGEAVGVIAAQSIGEPGTQLTLRTFHAAGIARKEITQGLPRVEELFEARTPKEPGLMADLSGIVKISEKESKKVITIVATEKVPVEFILKKEYVVSVKNNQKVKRGDLLFTSIEKGEVVASDSGTVYVDKRKLLLEAEVVETREYSVPVIAEVKVSNGDLVVAGDSITEGHLDLTEMLRLKGILSAQKYLLKEIQKVYKSQGVTTNDKHFEIMIRKMSEKVKVRISGDSKYLPGEYVDWMEFSDENEKIREKGGKVAKGKQTILGLIKASLLTGSWLSAASFQDTTNVLADTAVGYRPQSDLLLGLKENVIIGRLIPTGERARLNDEQDD